VVFKDFKDRKDLLGLPVLQVQPALKVHRAFRVRKAVFKDSKDRRALKVQLVRKAHKVD
jgi:hypothetical protein